MLQRLLACAALLTAVATAGAQDNNAPIIEDKEHGLLMAKPPRDEKWKCDPNSRWYGEKFKCGVNHVIDDLRLEVMVQFSSGKMNENWPSIRELGENVVKSYEDMKTGKDGRDAQFKDIKFITKDHKAKFMGAGGASGYYIHAEAVRSNDSKLEFHEWVFIKSNNLYRFVAVGSPGEFKKHLKDVNFIMSNFKITRPAKKK